MDYKEYACPMIPLQPMCGKDFVAAVAIKEDKRLLENLFWIVLKGTHYGVQYEVAPVDTIEELETTDRAGNFDDVKMMLIKSLGIAE